jgi:hypothetical protein
MERSVWRYVLPSGQTTWSGDRVERPSLTFPTDSGSSSSCRRMEPRLGPNRLKPWLTGEGVELAGRPTPGPTRPRVWPTWSTCEIHPRGGDDFDIWSTSLCYPLKCSNLVAKFLKSNKH